MRIRRPISPAYATPREAIQYLASVCDGAIRRDGHGFSSDHVHAGHQLAKRRHWGRRQKRSALRLVRVYQQQLTRAGFNVESILRNKSPQRISRLQVTHLQDGWFVDPSGLHDHRYWNGARWTHLAWSR